MSLALYSNAEHHCHLARECGRVVWRVVWRVVAKSTEYAHAELIVQANPHITLYLD